MLNKPIKNPYLDWIKSGEKVYEGRLYSKIKEWNLDVGMKIKFYDENNANSYVICKVVELLPFDDFGKAYDVLQNKLIPNNNKNGVITLYNKIFDNDNFDDGVSSPKILNVGVVAIGIMVIEMN